APGQGIIAIETRADDERVRRHVTAMSDVDARAELEAERALVVALGGGCQTPIGALATSRDDVLEIVAVVVAPDGSRAIRAESRGPRERAAVIGAHAGAQLLADGAAEILASARTVPNS